MNASQLESDPIRLAVLGDSIAFGQGATKPQDTLAERLTRGLGLHGLEAVSRVFAVCGARSSALPGQVDTALPWAPDVAVVVVGANDLTHLEPVEPALAALREGLSRLRAAGAHVVLAPAPDLSSVPHVPPVLRDAVREASRRYRRQQVEVAASLGVRVGDADGITAGAFADDPRLFSADRFHPSSAGYGVIAAALLPEVVAALTCRPLADRGTI